MFCIICNDRLSQRDAANHLANEMEHQADLDPLCGPCLALTGDLEASSLADATGFPCHPIEEC